MNVFSVLNGFVRHCYPSLLARYIFVRFLASFSRYAALFLLLLMLIFLLRMHDLIIEFGAPATTVFFLVLLSIPKLLTIVIPFSALLGSTSAIQRLSKQNELVIIRQTGLSNAVLLRPFVILSLTLAMLGWLNAALFIPLASQKYNSIKRSLNDQDIQIVLKAGRFNYLGNNTMLYARMIDPKGQYHDLMIVKTGKKGTTTILAERGLFNNDLNEPGFLLFDGTTQYFNRADQSLEIIDFDSFKSQVKPEEVDQISYWISSNERFIADLLFPDPDNKIDRQRFGDLISKGHDRLVSPLYFILLPLLAGLLMLLSPFDRQYRISRVVSILCFCFAILIVHRITLNMIANNTQMIWSTYVLALATAGLIIALWRRNTPLDTDFIGAIRNLMHYATTGAGATK